MKRAVISFLLLFFTAINLTAAVQGDFKTDDRRGEPSEYDPGPDKDSQWVKLFGSIPNYRALGQAILGGTGEKFRWQMGPMWYRGRLGVNQVKAFIVGQEGAQDENISNRAFTGSTGTKTQKFLNHLGLYRSYLFLNTFVYTINGQRDTTNPRYFWMEQNINSPIVKYRHSLFDQMLTTNFKSISLMMGVGAGGKESLATWINARGGKCMSGNDLEKCDVSGIYTWFKKNKNVKIENKILVVGVPHPGGANPNLGGDAAMQNIIRGFTNAAKRVATFKSQNPEWLPLDPDEKASDNEYIARLNSDYKYGNAPVPFRDFAYGTNWRMGSSGTSSNRWGADSIQVFSKDGEYAFKDHSAYGPRPSDKEELLDIIKTKSKNKLIVGMEPADVPYEPPKWYDKSPDHAKQYDYGPCEERETACDLAKLLQSWPNFYSDVAPVSAPDFGHGPVYRGRLQNAIVLVIADQTSHDDFFSARALTGEVGQKLQTWLGTIRVGSAYAILRTLPVDTLGMNPQEVRKIALRSDVLAARQKILDFILGKGNTKVIVTLGAVAQETVQSQSVGNVKVVSLDLSQNTSQINQVAKEVAAILGEKIKDSYNGRLTAIPREDLPVHTRWWMGTSGNRAQRGENADTLGIYYRLYAPGWVRSFRANPLSSAERYELKKLLKGVAFGVSSSDAPEEEEN